jgi:hypothetical protein
MSHDKDISKIHNIIYKGLLNYRILLQSFVTVLYNTHISFLASFVQILDPELTTFE